MPPVRSSRVASEKKLRKTHSQDFREKTEQDYDNVRNSFVAGGGLEAAGRLQAVLLDLHSSITSIKEDLSDLRRRAVLS